MAIQQRHNRDKAIGFLAAWGLEASEILEDGMTSVGYRSLILDEEGRRQVKSDELLTKFMLWPKGFDYDRFIECIYEKQTLAPNEGQNGPKTP